MEAYLIAVGLILILIGMFLLLVGAIRGKARVEWGVGGFIGPFPFGFATSKEVLVLLIALLFFGLLFFFFMR